MCTTSLQSKTIIISFLTKQLHVNKRISKFILNSSTNYTYSTRLSRRYFLVVTPIPTAPTRITLHTSPLTKLYYFFINLSILSQNHATLRQKPLCIYVVYSKADRKCCHLHFYWFFLFKIKGNFKSTLDFLTKKIVHVLPLVPCTHLITRFVWGRAD